MLNSFSDVDDNGKFTSVYKKISARFFKVTDRLLSGRLCIASINVGAHMVALVSALKYSQQRLAVGKTGLSDTPIMNFQLQQNALLPLVARSIILKIGHNASKQLFANPKGREHDLIKTLCVTKSMISWHTEEVGRVARERVGGAGFLQINALGMVIMGAHSGMTAEGDNSVLQQKVTKDIL